MKWLVSIRVQPQYRYYIYRNQRVNGKYLKRTVEMVVDLPETVHNGELGECYLVEGRLYPKSYFHLHTCTGVNERIQPGDVIDAVPFDKANPPRSKLKKCLMVVVDGLEYEQAKALTEEYYDINSYKPYNPMTLDEFRTALR